MLLQILSVIDETWVPPRIVQIELTKEITRVVNIPVIASGGCGKLEHFVTVFQEGKADAALAASVFHYNEFSISTVKKFLLENQVLKLLL